MATAKMHDGRAIVAYVNGVAVDASGEPIEGAPKQKKDTDPSKQPHALAQLNTDERSATVLATAFANALRRPAVASGDSAETEEQREDDEEPEMPKIADLKEYLEHLTTVADVEAMQASDERKGAQPLYEARLAELQAK